MIPVWPGPPWTSGHPSRLTIPVIVGIGAALALVAVFAEFSLTKVVVVLMLGIPIVALLSVSFELTVMTFIALLFSLQDAGVVKIVVPFAAAVGFSFVLTHRNVQLRDFSSPVTGPMALYLFSMLPSLLNTPDLGRTLPYLQNSIALAVIVLILGASIRRQKECKNYLGAFYVLAMINAFIVIMTGLSTGRRAYGIPGIVYVDFVVIIILFALNYGLFHRGGRRMWALVAVVIAVVALLLTQTRNTLLSSALCLAVYAVYLVRNNHLLNVSRRRLALGGVVLTVMLLAAVGFALVYLPQSFERIEQLGQSSAYELKTEEDFAVNSFVTRLLIWITAWNGFMEHPIFGVGAFSFPFASVLYFDFPPYLYRRWVEGLGPHVAYLAVLVETGIVGFVGFLVFLGSSLRMAFRSVSMSVTRDERFVSTTILLAQLYVVASMFLTDAWLWGQCGMLWALILGVSVANHRILARTNE